jgi:hypothetical protein
VTIETEVTDPEKDESKTHPVATVWRPALQAVVRAFVDGKYDLTGVHEWVPPVPLPTAYQIRSYVSDYGQHLSELPMETWSTSVSQWMGDCWHVLVDLWTTESGRTDMVLDVRIYENGEGFRIEVGSVYVP